MVRTQRTAQIKSESLNLSVTTDLAKGLGTSYATNNYTIHDECKSSRLSIRFLVHIEYIGDGDDAGYYFFSVWLLMLGYIEISPLPCACANHHLVRSGPHSSHHRRGAQSSEQVRGDAVMPIWWSIAYIAPKWSESTSRHAQPKRHAATVPNRRRRKLLFLYCVPVNVCTLLIKKSPK